MKTVGRNTKEFRKAISDAKNVSVYRLENDFHPAHANEIPTFAIEDGKLVKGEGKYSLRVHSNLWYEWAA